MRFFCVRPARTYSNGCKSLNRPDSGKVTAKGKGVRRETESRKPAANIWSDGQKLDMRPKGEDKIAREIEVR